LEIENTIGGISRGPIRKGKINNLYLHVAYVSQIELRGIDEVVKDENWFLTMQDEFHQF